MSSALNSSESPKGGAAVGSKVVRGPHAAPEALLTLLKSKLPGQFLAAHVSCGDPELIVNRERFLDLIGLLRLDAELRFDFLVDITAVDWLDAQPQRFEAVYNLLSTQHLYRLRVKVPLPESDPIIDSLTELWPGANFLEREVWDMFGITFRNHPDLRRTLMYEEFVGHPLRKDYPVQGKQPRVPLRYPEVKNTALDMTRPALVQIGSNRQKAGSHTSMG